MTVTVTVRTCVLWGLIALTGCLGPATEASRGEADRVARALSAVVRLHYERLLAARDEAQEPERFELEDANHELRAALAEAGARSPGDGDGFGAAAARNVLLDHDYVFLPPFPPERDEPGIALGRVLERAIGLSLEVGGRTVRYRRVVHDGVVLPHFSAYRAVRVGEGPLPALGRYREPTVFLDQDAIARRAGKGPYADLDAAALAAHVELRQVAFLRFASDHHPEDLLTPADRLQVWTRVHARVALAVLVEEGAGVTVIREMAAVLARPGDYLQSEVAAALVVREGLGLEEPPDGARARELLDGL